MKNKRIFLTLFIFVTLLFASASAIFSYAWYCNSPRVYTSDDDSGKIAKIGMRINLLFDRLNPEIISNGTDIGTGASYNKDAVWGTSENPYIISDVRHLHNLSALQKTGYFYKTYISKNYGEGGNYNGEKNMPYFLVCTNDGKPVTVDGSKIKRELSPIGSEEFPFIGFVGGAFSEGTCTVNAMQSDVSAIDNVTVKSTDDVPDVGLFGIIGFLGDESSADSEGKFTGAISTVSNLLLSDIKITVENPSFLEWVNNHRLSYDVLENPDDKENVPHEDHHIGILAGHVEYANVSKISVYYSNETTPAINLNHSEKNYMSSSGILGFIYNMNPDFTDGVIGAGSGTNSSEISIDNAPGTGGGLLSGTGRGYLTAKEILEMYPNRKADGQPFEETADSIKLLDMVDKNGTPLCTEWVRKRLLFGTSVPTGRYYFYDGVFTFSLSNQEDTVKKTWNGEPDSFYIGENDSASWKKNTSQGNNAVVAYVKKITSNQELNIAIGEGKQIFVMKENGESMSLMSLYDQSVAGSGDFELKYSTNAVTQYFGNQEFIDGLIKGYEDNEMELPADMSSETKENLLTWLRNGTIRAINVGFESSTVDLDTLKMKYKITAGTTGNHSYFNEYTPVPVNNDSTISEYYDYSNSVYDGYFYYTSKKVLWWTNYTYYWQPKDGELIELDKDSNTAPGSYFTDTGEAWEEEKVYSKNGYTGVVVNKQDNVFFDSNNKVNANGNILTKPTSETVQFFFKDVGENDYYHSTDTAKNTPIAKASFIDTGKTSLSGQKIFSYNGKEGVLLDRYQTYTFSSNANYLRMIKAVFSSYGTRFVLWNGSEAEAEKGSNFTHTFVLFSQTPTVSNSKEATLRFNPDGTCYIQYTIDSTGYYVNSAVNGTTPIFNTATSNTASSTKLSIYTVEGTQTIKYGRITFQPTDESAVPFPTDEYVLWPNQTESGANTISNPTYTVKSLEELYEEDGGWQNNKGQKLTKTDLVRKFNMNSQVNWDILGTSGSINWGDQNIATDGVVVAPVGTLGTKATIPQGAVAFRINKTGESKIRVIVALPQSDLSKSERESEGTDTLSDCYFGVWQVPDSNQNGIVTFSRDNAIEKFYLPISEPYDPATSANEASQYQVTYNGNENYRLYPNGNRILAAYTFNVSTEGIYILATTGQPMEIVYFSADGTASAGRDGVSGSFMGDIDFVYDNGSTKIVTVNDVLGEGQTAPNPNDNGEDYDYYYATLCLMYTDNGAKQEDGTFPQINNLSVCIRRSIFGEATAKNSKLTVNVAGQSALLQVNPYSVSSDEVERIDAG